MPGTDGPPARGGMQRTIRQLPESIANRIAAGEVVERPASVVKELVENALDAGATRIEIEIREGGREYIRVTDDGAGIPADQVLLAFERHATSKLDEASDLFAIGSLGFRGEALPSIASVSEMEFRTRPRGQEHGVLVHMEGGKLLAHRLEGCGPGTSVVVRRLFFNTPARYKFLRTPMGEGRHVLDTVGRLALAHPGCRFTLVSDGRTALQTVGDGDMHGAIAGVFGRRVASALIPCSASWPGARLEGWLGHPDLHRGNRDLEVLVVNGRPIHSPALLRAIEKGYETLLPSRRFPVAVLHLHLDPALVDVNVHPTKREVRFADEQTLFRRIFHAVRDALVGANLFRSLEGAAGGGGGGGAGGTQAGAAQAGSAREGRPFTPLPLPPMAPWPRQPAAPAWRGPLPAPQPPPPLPPLLPKGGAAPEPVALPPRGPACAARSAPGAGAVAEGPGLWAGENGSGATAGGAEEARRLLQEIQLVGCLDNTFLLGVGAGRLWVIDQHVAHERILYERFLQAGSAPAPVAQQRLLHPLLFHTTAAEAAALAQQQQFLEAAGFSIEPFGPNAFRLTGIPAPLAGMEAEMVEEALRESVLGADGSGSGPEGRAVRLAASLACRMAVKAGDRLPLEQGEALVAQLAGAENPFTCPHGRPIVVTISRRELERRFGRH